MKVYDGPAFVAAKTGATVLPVRLDGPSRSYFSRLSGKYPRLPSPHPHHGRPPPPFPCPAADRQAAAAQGWRGDAPADAGDGFASRPQQTCSAPCATPPTSSARTAGCWKTKQIEYSYKDLLKMAIMLGRLVERLTAENERVGLLLPNLAPTLAC